MKIGEIIKEDEYGRDQGAMYDNGGDEDRGQDFSEAHSIAYEYIFDGFDKANHTLIQAGMGENEIKVELAQLAKEMTRQYS